MSRRTQAQAPTRSLLGALAVTVDYRANPELSDLYAAVEADWAVTNVTLPYEHVAHYLRQGAPRRFDLEHPRWAPIEFLHGRPLPEAERRHIVEHTSDTVVVMTVLETQAVTAAERDDALTQHLRRLNATDTARIVRRRHLEIQESEHLESVLRLCLYGRARGRWNQLDAHRVGERALLRYPADRVSGLVYERLTSNGLCPDRSEHLLDYAVSRHPEHAEWIIEEGWPRQLAALARSRHAVISIASAASWPP